MICTPHMLDSFNWAFAARTVNCNTELRMWSRDWYANEVKNYRLILQNQPVVVDASQSATGNVPQKRCIMHLQSRDQEEKHLLKLDGKNDLDCARKWIACDCTEAELARKETGNWVSTLTMWQSIVGSMFEKKAPSSRCYTSLRRLPWKVLEIFLWCQQIWTQEEHSRLVLCFYFPVYDH